MKFLSPIRLLFAVGLVGILAGTAFGLTEPEIIWANLLINNFIWLSIVLASMTFYSMHILANANWVFRLFPIFRSIGRYLPAGIFIFVLILSGIDQLFPWADSPVNAELNSFKRAYLHKIFFFFRNLLCFFAWFYFARKLIRAGNKHLNRDALHNNGLIKTYSAIFILIFTLTFTGISWDWLLSVNIPWYSTLFAWYVIIGAMLSAVSFIILWIEYKGIGFNNKINAQISRDMRVYLIAFCIIWEYMWYSQFMLIWYGNLPDEISFFHLRLREYPIMFYASMILSFGVPLITLMIFGNNRSKFPLVISGFSVLAGQWMDKYIIVLPAVSSGYTWCRILIEASMAIFFISLFVIIIEKGLNNES